MRSHGTCQPRKPLSMCAHLFEAPRLLQDAGSTRGGVRLCRRGSLPPAARAAAAPKGRPCIPGATRMPGRAAMNPRQCIGLTGAPLGVGGAA